MTDTVVAELRGGLGNQLFQYAACEALARERGATARYLTLDIGATRRLEQFLQLELPWASRADAFLLGRGNGSAGLWRRRYQRVLHRLSAHRVAIVHQGPFAAAFESRPPDIAARDIVGLFGYFQHPSWFDSVLDDVVERISRGARARDGWQRPDAVAVSFRRGDYVGEGWALPLDFYDTALERLGGPSAGPLLVVGDDAEFCDLAEAEYRRRGYNIVGDRSASGDALTDDFWSIAGAGDVVMSNSTFCWWATVVGDALAGERRRTVCFPERWILGEGTALCRSGWTVCHMQSDSAVGRSASVPGVGITNAGRG